MSNLPKIPKPSLSTEILNQLESRRKKGQIQTPEELYGVLSCKLHEIANKIIKKEKISVDLILVICECCYAIECLDVLGYKPLVIDKELANCREKIADLQSLLKEVIDMYAHTEYSRQDQVGQPPKKLVDFPPSLINKIFLLFNS